jgi:hypothetical protein
MNKLFILFLAFTIQISCKSGKDIFATFNGGSITRSEFNGWLESRNVPLDLIYKDKYAMSDYLHQIAVEKLTSEKAEKSGFNNERFYLIIEKTLNKNLLATFFTSEIKTKITFTEKAADLSIIRLFTKKTKTQSFSEENKNIIVNKILSDLNDGQDFNALAKKYSEDAASVKNGHLGVLPEYIMEPGILDAISHLSENQYTSRPVILGDSICLIKLHNRYTITEKNIAGIINDKKTSDRIIDFYTKRFLDDLRTKILQDKSVVTNINNISFKKENEVIFSIRGEDFKSEELNDILKLFYLLRYGMLPVDEFSFEEKKITAEKIFQERIFALEANRNGIDSDIKFKRNWIYLRRAALAGLYKYNSFLKDLSVSDSEVLQEYTLNRLKKYYSVKKINNKEKKVYLSFNDAKLKIRNQLIKEKLKNLKKRLDSDILAESNYAIRNKDFN